MDKPVTVSIQFSGPLSTAQARLLARLLARRVARSAGEPLPAPGRSGPSAA